jgi:hypothetical protein
MFDRLRRNLSRLSAMRRAGAETFFRLYEATGPAWTTSCSATAEFGSPPAIRYAAEITELGPLADYMSPADIAEYARLRREHPAITRVLTRL